MNLFKICGLILMSIVVSACATVTGSQADCFTKHQKFSDAATCMRGELEKLKWGSNVPLSALHDYQLYLSLVEAKVKRGELSDEDAKIQMQEYLIRLRNSYK